METRLLAVGQISFSYQKVYNFLKFRVPAEQLTWYEFFRFRDNA